MSFILKRLHSLSVTAKLALLIFLVISLFSTTIIFIAMENLKKQTNEVISEMINSNIKSNKDFLASAILANDNWKLFKFLKSFSQNSIIKSAGIVDKNFVVLADTDTKVHRIGTHLKKDKKDTIIPFKKDGILLGYFVLNIEKNSVRKILEKNLSKNFLLMIGAALLSFLFAVYFMKNLLKRLNVVVENAKAISLKRWDDIKDIQSVENDDITELIKTTTYLMKEIREQVTREEQLKNFYHQILNSIDIFIIICDVDLNIQYQNNHKLKKYILKDDKTFKGNMIKNLIECYKSKHCIFCKQKISDELEGDISLYYQARLVNDYFILSFSDITQLSKFEENERVAHSLQTVGEISSLFAHEIKNLLQPLKLLLLDEDSLDKKDFEIVSNTLNRMDAQVVDFLSLGKPLVEKMPMTPLNVKSVVLEIYNILKLDINDKNINFIMDIDDDLEIFINKNSIEMILMNLIKNAIDALPKNINGYIEIFWHKTKENFTILRVKDNGIGIPKSSRKNLFKPFFTTKQNGSGLGLFTVYKIVYLSGGSMKLLNSDDTIFEIALPVKNQKYYKEI